MNPTKRKMLFDRIEAGSINVHLFKTYSAEDVTPKLGDFLSDGG
jgi:hypothetical protein